MFCCIHDSRVVIKDSSSFSSPNKPSLLRIISNHCFLKTILKPFIVSSAILIALSILLDTKSETDFSKSLSETNALIDKSSVRCWGKDAEGKMIKSIDNAKSNGDSVGGLIEIYCSGLPFGLGSYTQWDKKLQSKISETILSINAFKGIEFGMGFDISKEFGSKVHDEIFYDEKQFKRKTNNAGGIEGGMSNTEPLMIKLSMKPIPTLLFSSPYFRAKETAGYISEVTGLNPIYLDGLKEMDSGEMEGIKASEMNNKYPEYMANWRRDHSTARPPGGETLGEVHTRAWKSILEIFNEYNETFIAVVAHLFPIQGILCNVLGIHSNHFQKLEINLGSISSIEIQKDSYRLITMNETF